MAVCASVALRHANECLEAIVPIIENVAFWELDEARLVLDLSAGSETSTRSFGRYFALGNEKDFEKLAEIAKEPSRQLHIGSLVIPILLNAPPSVCERVQAAIRSFPENPPRYYEGEGEDGIDQPARLSQYRTWAAYAERENYDIRAVDEQQAIAIQFKVPAEIEAEQQEGQQALDAIGRLYGFQNWCTVLLDEGRIGNGYTFDSAMVYARELMRVDDPTHKPTQFLEDSEHRAMVIATFAAALVLHAWDWVEEHDYVFWCREQLLIASTRPEPPGDRADEVQRFPSGYRRSAARALPILLARFPQDTSIRKAILGLAVHVNQEVRSYLFIALRPIWEVDAAFVCECIGRVERNARMRAVRNRYRALSNPPDVIVHWGRFARLKRLRARIGLFTRLLLVGWRPKPIRDCIYKDIAMHPLDSTLYSRFAHFQNGS